MSPFIYLVLAGIAGGFLAGLIGIGGGVVYVFVIPIALKAMGVPDVEIAQYTIANSIFAIFFASATANYSLFKRGDFYLRPVIIIGGVSIMSSLLTLQFIVNTTWFSVREFNIAVIILMLFMLVYTLLNAKKEYNTPLDNLSILQFSLVGICSGFVASISGLGGGIVIIPLLNLVMKTDIKKATYVSSGVIMITSLSMTFFNMMETVRVPLEGHSLGYIIFPVGLLLSAGVVFSSPYGVKTAAKLSPKIISYIYATVLCIVIIKKIVELVY